MTNTNKKTIEGIRLIAKDTQRVKIFDKVGYTINGNHAVIELLNEASNYQDRYMKDYVIYESACIEYANIDFEALKKQAKELANQEDDENEVYFELFNKAIENINPPYSLIMKHITDEIGYYHQIQLYDGTEWYDETEIDTIDYDDEEKGTFTLKEDEE